MTKYINIPYKLHGVINFELSQTERLLNIKKTGVDCLGLCNLFLFDYYQTKNSSFSLIKYPGLENNLATRSQRSEATLQEKGFLYFERYLNYANELGDILNTPVKYDITPRIVILKYHIYGSLGIYYNNKILSTTKNRGSWVVDYPSKKTKNIVGFLYLK